MLLVLAALLPARAAAQLQIPAPQGYVNDFAGVIDPAYQDSLEAVIDAVREHSGGEIVVVTLPSLQGRDQGEVALQIGREWAIGRKGGPTDRDRNTGVVVLLSMQDRKWRIETGTGAMTFITAAEAGRIGRDVLVPELRAGNVGRGLLLAVDTLAQAYATQYHFALEPAYPASTASPGAAPPGYRPPPADYGRGRSSGGSFWTLLILVILVMLLTRGRVGCLPLFFGGFGGGGGYRGGGFGGGGWGGGGFGGGGGGGFGGFGGGGGFSGGGSGGSW